MRTEFNGRMFEDYPTQRRLVDALAGHDIDVECIKTTNETVRLRIPIEDARRLTALLKETDAHR